MNVYSLAEHEGMVVESEPCHVKVFKICKTSKMVKESEPCHVLEFVTNLSIIIVRMGKVPIMSCNGLSSVFLLSGILYIVVLDTHTWTLSLNTITVIHIKMW